MKIRNIKIRNFRGIRELDWALPDSSLFCLIGKGDSTKSTVLEAIRYVFYPQWNLILNDSDFYLCQTHNPLLIEVMVGNLPEEFCSLDKYGRFLFGWNQETLECADEPGVGLEEILIIRFQVGQDLEPNWEVLDHTYETGAAISQFDRAKANVALIGSFTDRHLTWGRGSILNQLTETENAGASLADAARSAKNSLDADRKDKLSDFDNTAQRAEDVARNLGVPVTNNFKAQLDLGSVYLNQGGLSLHDGDIPLRQVGLGSRRMLICGLQKEALDRTHITLFDEVEIGLEPHRIARLLKHVMNDTSGQYFLTTHSPTVLRELTINELYIVHNHQGKIQILAAADNNLEGLNIQGNMRSSAEAFLAEKVILCEGQTEVGFARGLDNYWTATGLSPFSFQGAAVLNAHGASKIKGLAEGFRSLLYDVAVIADGDAPDKFSNKDAEELENSGVEVLMWSNEAALEERIMLDLPWKYVLASVKLAKEEFNQPVYENVRSQLNAPQNETIDKWIESDDLRRAIAKAAKAKENPWFKKISKAQRWMEVIAPALIDETIRESDLVVNISKLRSWVDRD
jgi:putative ATP-dependent endonuclease of OLD family